MVETGAITDEAMGKVLEEDRKESKAAAMDELGTGAAISEILSGWALKSAFSGLSLLSKRSVSSSTFSCTEKCIRYEEPW